MPDMTPICDDNSCDQAPNVQGSAAWKSLAGQLAGRFPTAMSELLRGHAQLQGASVSQLQADQFRGVLSGLAYGRMYSWTSGAEDHEGQIWLGLDADAAAAMMDVILGGKPYQESAGSRALTAIDRRLLRRVVDRAAGLVASLAGLQQPLSPRQAEHMTEPSCVAAICLDMDIGGAMWLFVDAELCEGSKPGAKGGPIELSATLNVEEIASDQLSDLAIGDVIATDVSVEGEIVVRLAGIPKYIGQLSTVDGKKAITITRKISEPNDQ